MTYDTSRLRKLAEWAREPHIVTVNKATPLTDWYHDNGPLALVGNAAQPQTVSNRSSSHTSGLRPIFRKAGGVQEVAIGFEDGIVLGRIFSYLRRREQIPSFLEAYEDVCRERDIKTYYKELANIEFLTLPREHAEPRNALMREKGKNGQNLFGINMPADNAASDGWEEWQGIMDLFAYNAEEAADDWWQSHGRMIEASGGGVFDGPKLQILVALNIKEGKED
jgi:salicylate hydroxylase